MLPSAVIESLGRCAAGEEVGRLIDTKGALLNREYSTFVEVAAREALAAGEDVALIVLVLREGSDITARLLHLVQARAVGHSHALGL